MNRLRLFLAVAALATVAVVATACGDDGGAKSSGTGPDITVNGTRDPNSLNGGYVTPVIPMPDVTLTDTSGQPFSLKQQTQGELTLLYLGYTHCPDVCPTHMANLSSALSKLDPSMAQHVKVVFVTTDPERDTPAELRAWLDQFDTSFVGLTGTIAQINALSADLGLPPVAKEPLENGDYGVSHSAFVLAFTNDGISHIVYPDGITAADWQHDIPQLVQGWKGS